MRLYFFVRVYDFVEGLMVIVAIVGIRLPALMLSTSPEPNDVNLEKEA
jgi:hypothetical protein